MKQVTLNAILFCWFIVLLGSNFPSKIEGTYFPVVENVKFSYETGSNITNVTLDYLPVRECQLKNIYWYIGKDENTKMRISTIIQAADVEENIDGRKTIMWTMNSSIAARNLSSTVYLEHNCHPLWPTITRIK